MDEKYKHNNIYTHGGDIYSHYEKYGKYPLDFSSNLNPYIIPEPVKEAYIYAFNESFIYPPYDYKILRESIAQFENVNVENVCVSNGATELIRYIPLIFRKENALITAPAFSEYEKSCINYNIYKYLLKKENDFIIQEDFYKHILENSVIFLTNPDNPIGNILDIGFIETVLNISKEKNSILLLDECFMDLSSIKTSAISLIKKYDNLIIIKAFTKTFSFAGLRLGYALSNSDIIYKFNNMLAEWRVSMPAYKCGIAILKDKHFIKSSLKYIEEEKKYLLDSFALYGFNIFGSNANYIFFYCNIFNLKERLENYNILIRDCSNYEGLEKGYYRVAVKKHEDNKMLINALNAIL